LEIYSSEEQQEEAIKRFLKENGTSLVIGAVIGLGGIWGWNYYQKLELVTMGQHSIEFSKLSKSSDVISDGEKYVAGHGDSQYSQLTQLLMVKSLVQSKEYDKATAILKQVIASDVESAVISVAKTRLARIELATGNYDNALSTLNSLEDNAFGALKNELLGDVHIANGDDAKARSAYQAAVEAAGERVSNDLRMKLDDLAPAV